MGFTLVNAPRNLAPIKALPSSTSDAGTIGVGCLVYATSHRVRVVSALAGTSNWYGVGSTSEGAPNQQKIMGIALSASTGGGSTALLIQPVGGLELLEVPWSTTVSSTYITTTNIGTYLKLVDSSHVDGSTGVTTIASSDNNFFCLQSWSTETGKVRGYIPSFFLRG